LGDVPEDGVGDVSDDLGAVAEVDEEFVHFAELHVVEDFGPLLIVVDDGETFVFVLQGVDDLLGEDLAFGGEKEVPIEYCAADLPVELEIVVGRFYVH
jgi:hypothetical protein